MCTAVWFTGPIYDRNHGCQISGTKWRMKAISSYFVQEDVIKWKHFPRYWPFMWGIHRVPVNSPHKGQWRRALMLSLICTWINGWVNNREADGLIRHSAHYDVTVMPIYQMMTLWHRNIFCVTGYLRRECIAHRWFPTQRASNAEIWLFLCSQPEQPVEQSFHISQLAETP